MLAPLAFAGPVEANGTFTVLPANTVVDSINDSGVVAGLETSGLGFLRTPDGTITTFQAGGNTFTEPQWINGSGVIAGYYFDNSSVAAHGFVRDADGAITTFDAPGASQTTGKGTFATRINAQGVVTGYYIDQTGSYHGFVRAVDGTVTSIDVAGAILTWATGINDKGEVVGFWENSGQSVAEHGFVRSAKGQITTFDVPEGVRGTEADAINNKGVITGGYLDETQIGHGFIRQPDGTITTFDTGAGADTLPTAINNKGTIAGLQYNTQGRYRGFIRSQSGKVKTVSAPNYNGGTAVYSINTNGVVAGYLQTRPNRHTPYTAYGYIWTP